MTVLLFQPHSDDCALFAAFLACKHEPLVVTVFRSVRQESWGVTDEERVREDHVALHELGVTQQVHWPLADDVDGWADEIRARMRELRDQLNGPDLVVAPAPLDPWGHPQHDLVGLVAREVFGEGTVGYLTYTGSPAVKKRSGREVVPEPWMIARKLRALACYGSQHRIASGSREHFMEDLREYTSA